MSATGNAARLTGLTRELRQQWGFTCEHWADDKAREFEARYLAELDSNVQAVTTRIETLEALLRKIRRDCE